MECENCIGIDANKDLEDIDYHELCYECFDKYIELLVEDDEKNTNKVSVVE